MNRMTTKLLKCQKWPKLQINARDGQKIQMNARNGQKYKMPEMAKKYK